MLWLLTLRKLVLSGALTVKCSLPLTCQPVQSRDMFMVYVSMGISKVTMVGQSMKRSTTSSWLPRHQTRLKSGFELTLS